MDPREIDINNTLYREMEKTGENVRKIMEQETQVKTTRKCPKCGRIYNEASALSREDNKTAICSICGTEEALDAAGMPKESSIRKAILYAAGKEIGKCKTH